MFSILQCHPVFQILQWNIQYRLLPWIATLGHQLTTYHTSHMALKEQYHFTSMLPFQSTANTYYIKSHDIMVPDSCLSNNEWEKSPPTAAASAHPEHRRMSYHYTAVGKHHISEMDITKGSLVSAETHQGSLPPPLCNTEFLQYKQHWKYLQFSLLVFQLTGGPTT